MVWQCIGSLLVLNLLLAGWVLQDSLKRRTEITWALGALLLGPIMLPMYRGRRPLLPGEVRQGGPDWIVARHFAWTWTLVMLIVIFWTALTISKEDGAAGAGAAADSNAATLGQSLTLLFLGVCWLVPVAGALFFSMVAFVPDEVESLE